MNVIFRTIITFKKKKKKRNLELLSEVITSKNKNKKF